MTKSEPKKIEVTYYGDEMVESIKRIDEAFKKLRLSGFNYKGLVTLIYAMGAGVSKRDIEFVINRLDDLANYYLVKETKK